MSSKIINIIPNYFEIEPIIKSPPHKVADYLYSHVLPTPIKSPSITLFNSDLNSLLNCDIDLKNPLLLSGSLILEKSIPVSHNYSGHQFGLFVGQLGDGRVSTLFDLDTSHLKNKNIFNEIDEDKMLSKIEFSLKGIGKTPYSRDADGRIIFSATIREFLASEAMYYLGVPTSRAFSIAIGEELIERDIFFDGKITIENNAIISRLAPNFIRFGSFEKFITDVEFIGNSSEKMNKNNEMFESLINFLLDHDFNEIKNKFSEKKERYFEIYKEVIKRTAFLVAKWQSIGFCHGALNTDNMSILGITLDYGPFGFLEKTKNSYNPNYSDHAKRYNFVNQPGICAYNLVKLAEAMKFWINEKDAIEYLKNSYPKFYDKFYYENMRKKLGLFFIEENDDKKLINSLLFLMENLELDFTLTFRYLSLVSIDENYEKFTENDEYFLETIKNNCQYSKIDLEKLKEWMINYKIRLNKESKLDNDSNLKYYNIERKTKMNKINPNFILRSSILNSAIIEAKKNNFTLINKLYDLLKSPYDEITNEDELFFKINKYFNEICVSCSS